MKEYELDNITLMGGWHIPNKICGDLIKFMKSQSLQDGMMYQDNGGQQVVEVMGNPSRHGADSLHLLGLVELRAGFHQLPVGDVGLVDGDEEIPDHRCCRDKRGVEGGAARRGLVIR